MNAQNKFAYKSINLFLALLLISITLLGGCAPAGTDSEEPERIEIEQDPTGGEQEPSEVPPVLDATNLGDEFAPGRIIFASDLLMLTPDLIAQMEPAYEDSDTITAAELDATGGDIKFIQVDASRFYQGQIISTGVSDETPYGLLRKVVEVNQVGSEVLVTTEQAKLEDAVQEGEFSVSYSEVISSLDSNISYQGGGVLMKRSPKPEVAPIEIPLNHVLYEDAQGRKVKATGNISITPDFFFSVDILEATIQDLKFENKTHIEANIDIFSGMEFSSNVYKEVYTKYLPPFTVPDLPFIVITPKIVVVVGLNGQVSSGITVGATYTNDAEIAAVWEDGNWSLPRDSNAKTTFKSPEFRTNLSAKVYAQPRLELLFWGAVGPYAQVEGYFKLNASPQDDPWWTLELGIDAAIGLSIDVFGLVKLNPLDEKFSIYHRTIKPEPVAQQPATEPPPPAPTEPPPPEPTEPPPPPPTEPPPPQAGTGNENIRVVYNNNFAYVMGIVQDSVRVKGLEFKRIDNQGNETASFHSQTWAGYYSGYDPIQPGYCPRIALPNSPSPPDCAVSVNFETQQERYHFWRETSTSKQFQVLQNGSLLQTCEISAGSCDVYVPQP